MSHLGPHSEVMGREKESRPGVLLFGGSRVGAGAFAGSFFIGELKT